MPAQLLKKAAEEGITIVYWDFEAPVEAMYWCPKGVPVIGLSNSLQKDPVPLRCILAEELGHHFTSVGVAPRPHYRYRDRLQVSRTEHRALCWAANFLLPADKLVQAIRKGIRYIYELAEHFRVTEEIIRTRFKMLSIRGSASYAQIRV